MIGELKPDIAPDRKSKRQQRFDMVQYAIKHGISAAAREFNTTRKTVRMWLNRYRREGEEGLSNRSHHNRIRRVAGFYRSGNAGTNQEPCMELSPQRISELVHSQYPGNGKRRLNMRQSRQVPDIQDSDYTQGSSSWRSNESGTIQFDILDLESIDRYSSYWRKFNLPRYQYTACHKQSGAVWIAFAFNNTLIQKLEFWQVLTNHLKKSGLDTAHISVECLFDNPSGRRDTGRHSSELIQAVEDNFARCQIYTREKVSFKSIENFHRLIAEKIYSAANIRTVRKLLKVVDEFVISYNYHSRNSISSGLPPYQLFCRSAGSLCREDILAMPPNILDEAPRAGSILSAFLNPLRRVFNFVPKVDNKKSAVGPVVPIMQSHSKSTATLTRDRMRYLPQFEFINLKGVEWSQSAPNHSPADRIGRKHHRREIIEKARVMLEQKEAPDRSGGNLPLTEGELALLNQKISMDRQVRNR